MFITGWGPHEHEGLEDNNRKTSIIEQVGYMRIRVGVKLTGPDRAVFTGELRKRLIRQRLVWGFKPCGET